METDDDDHPGTASVLPFHSGREISALNKKVKALEKEVSNLNVQFKSVRRSLQSAQKLLKECSDILCTARTSTRKQSLSAGNVTKLVALTNRLNVMLATIATPTGED